MNNQTCKACNQSYPATRQYYPPQQGVTAFTDRTCKQCRTKQYASKSNATRKVRRQKNDQYVKTEYIKRYNDKVDNNWYDLDFFRGTLARWRMLKFQGAYYYKSTIVEHILRNNPDLMKLEAYEIKDKLLHIPNEFVFVSCATINRVRRKLQNELD